MVKEFLAWIGLKERIHTTSTGPKLYKEGDIWWCALGENINIEMNGKGSMFSRPVLVYKKLSREGFMCIPLSTKIKNGSWYVEVSFQGKIISANIAQARVISVTRCYSKMGELDEKDFAKVKSGFLRLYS